MDPTAVIDDGKADHCTALFLLADCSLSHPIGSFVTNYFAVLLVHRSGFNRLCLHLQICTSLLDTYYANFCIYFLNQYDCVQTDAFHIDGNRPLMMRTSHIH